MRHPHIRNHHRIPQRSLPSLLLNARLLSHTNLYRLPRLPAALFLLIRRHIFQQRPHLSNCIHHPYRIHPADKTCSRVAVLQARILAPAPRCLIFSPDLTEDMEKVRNEQGMEAKISMLEKMDRRYAFGVFRDARGKERLGIERHCHVGPWGRSNINLGSRVSALSGL
jgi:hypothetical protein